MVFETLNRLKWTGNLKECSITILHRGAPNDMKMISGERVTELKKSHFTYESSGRESSIPLHRVLEVKIGKDVLWRRRTRKG